MTRPVVSLLPVEGNLDAMLANCERSLAKAGWHPAVAECLIEDLAETRVFQGHKALLVALLEVFEVPGINDHVEYNADHPLFKMF